MQEEPHHPLSKLVPGHLFQFEEKIWGMTLHQLLMDLGAVTGSMTLTGSLTLVLRLIVCAVLTILALILIHGKVQGSTLGFWLYLRVRSKMVPAKTIWQPRQVANKRTHPRRKKRLPSVQATWVPIDMLQHGIASKSQDLKKTESVRSWTVLEVEGKNIRLLPEHEQIRIFRRFEGFLTGLIFHLQFISLTSQIDPQTSPALLVQKEALVTLSATPHLQALQRASLEA